MFLKYNHGFILLSILVILQSTIVISSAIQLVFQEGELRRLPHRKVSTRQTNSPLQQLSHVGKCECVDYWQCVSNDGQIYSYCGISDSDVCCFYQNKSTNKDNKLNNEANKTPIPASTTLPTSSIPTKELFQSENQNSSPFQGFITITPTPSISPFSLQVTSALPDVDYFVSIEDGNDNLKQIVTSSITQRAIANDGKICGRQAIRWELDSKATVREWPWHVALLEVNQDAYVCGGTLISQRKVVTAAHCVKSYTRPNAPKLKIRAGEFDISTNSEEDPYFEILVETIVVHPNFNNATLYNDIAILQLRSALNYSYNIQPLCLPTHNNDDSLVALHNENRNKCVVTGWGRPIENSSFSLRLKEIVVPLRNHSECQSHLRRKFGNSYKLPDTAICAGDLGHDACDGDGGGGLTCFNPIRNQWELVGVVSFGIGCGRIENPGVYTSVLPYLEWIDAFNYF